MRITYDDHEKDWKVGDWVVFSDEPFEQAMQITEIDEWERVHWKEEGEDQHTRSCYLLRKVVDEHG